MTYFILFLVFLNTSIFFFLSGLHVYWAFGGQWAIRTTIPQSMESGFFDPNRRTYIMLLTLAVAVGLGIMGLLTLANSSLFPFPELGSIPHFSMLGIALIFLIRAIGDFREVGFFKKQREGDFARNDSRIYSPLCVLISATAAGIFLLA